MNTGDTVVKVEIFEEEEDNIFSDKQDPLEPTEEVKQENIEEYEQITVKVELKVEDCDSE